MLVIHKADKLQHWHVWLSEVILKFSTRQRWVAPWPLYCRGMAPGIHWVGCWVDPVASLWKISWCCQELNNSPQLSTLYSSHYIDRREGFVYFLVCCSAVFWLHSMVGGTAYQHSHWAFLHAARPIYFGSIWEKACCWWVHWFMCMCAHTNINSLFQCVVKFCFLCLMKSHRLAQWQLWHK